KEEGKITTIKMLTVILGPNGDDVEVPGMVPHLRRNLDEPTIGLDVVAKHRVRDFLREINRTDGATVLLTTHDMTDVEQLCSRLLIIDHGTLLYDGTLDGIRDRLGTERTLVVDLAEDRKSVV